MIARAIARQIRKATDPWRRQDDLLAFVHIPKTAGTSLVSAFKKEFRRSRVLRLDEADQIRKFNQADLRRDYDFLHGHFGMMDVETVATSHVTVMRDPAARILSLYNYWRVKAAEMEEDSPSGELPDAMRLAQTLSFRDFVFSDVQRIVDDLQNAQSYQIAASNKSMGRKELAGASEDDLFRLACAKIDRMSVAGCVETLPQFERNVRGTLGLDIAVPVKNQTKYRTQTIADLPQDVLDRINAINQVDNKLHAYVLNKQENLS